MEQGFTEAFIFLMVIGGIIIIWTGVITLALFSIIGTLKDAAKLEEG